jgi:TorA maturation chaperone TorD
MMTATGKSVSNWLREAADWRFFSLWFRLPSQETEAEIVRLSAEVSAELRELAQLRQQITPEGRAQEFHRVLGAGGLPACASSYDDNALAGRGPMLADISGFYQAFAYRPEPPPAEVPDHLAVELDFFSYLAVKVAFAQQEGREAEAAIALRAYERFFDEHLRSWLDRFHAQLERTASRLYVPASGRLMERIDQCKDEAAAPADSMEVTPEL